MDLKKLLNQEQLDAVTHKEGPLLVLAGAGSGKTRIVTYRIASLIAAGVVPSSILAVTFTNKAAGEMQERVAELTRGQELASYPLICTFHSLGVRILRESIEPLGYPKNFLIYDEEDTQKILKECIESLGIKKEDGEVKTFKNWISNSKNQLLYPEDMTLEDTPGRSKNTFLPVYRLYQERLKEAGALDFDDLLLCTVRLFQKDKATLERYQERWKYLLIDEYQDTNYAQYLLAHLLVEKSNNICVVGDPDQSIYSWRGANIKNILNFEKDYPGARVVRLEQNYRSRKNILDAANALIRHNTNRFEKNLWSLKETGEKITLFVGYSDREEAQFVCQELERIHTFHRIPYREMAIFYRTNFQSRPFEDALLRKRIPYVIVGGISFYHRREIKDVLAFLRMVEQGKDFLSFARTINLPKRGIGETTLEKLIDAIRVEKMDIIDCCRNPPPDVRLNAKQREGLAAYANLITTLRALKDEVALEELVSETVRRTNYLDVLREEKETFEDRKGNVDELIGKAAEWKERPLSEFLEELTLKSSLDEANLEEDRTNLMTLHNGKGLEFAVVFLVGMEEDLFPHANAREHIDGVEEERRLCYVGMTRAKERLYLTAAETRFIWGTHRMMRPSRFLREIPREYFERLH